MSRRACHGVTTHETSNAAYRTRPTIVDEEALLVMKRHSDTPLNTTCTAKRDCDKSPPYPPISNTPLDLRQRTML
jgi:hypothetical protein